MLCWKCHSPSSSLCRLQSSPSPMLKGLRARPAPRIALIAVSSRNVTVAARGANARVSRRRRDTTDELRTSSTTLSANFAISRRRQITPIGARSQSRLARRRRGRYWGEEACVDGRPPAGQGVAFEPRCQLTVGVTAASSAHCSVLRSHRSAK